MKLTDLEKNLQDRLKRSLTQLPDILGNEGVVWIKQNFRRQGYPGTAFTAWKQRSANAKRNKGRAILVDSGRLSRSPRIMSKGPLSVNIGTDVPYAAAHNQGFTGVVTVKSHKRNKFGTMRVSTGKSNRPFRNKKTVVGKGEVRSHQRRMNLPQRQFAGPSPVLQSILVKKAAVHVGRELKK